jgi:hypothetical protein
MNQDNDNELEIAEQIAPPRGVRGKCYARYREGANLVLLAPDVAEVFCDSTSVNAALRQFLAEHGAPPAKTTRLLCLPRTGRRSDSLVRQGSERVGLESPTYVDPLCRSSSDRLAAKLVREDEVEADLEGGEKW